MMYDPYGSHLEWFSIFVPMLVKGIFSEGRMVICLARTTESEMLNEADAISHKSLDLALS